MPPSDTLAQIGSRPSVMIVKGLWDEVPGGTFQAFDAYHRAGPDKELYYVRGPHSEIAWGDQNIAFVQGRMIAYARRVADGGPLTQPRYVNLKQAVAASPP